MLCIQVMIHACMLCCADMCAHCRCPCCLLLRAQGMLRHMLLSISLGVCPMLALCFVTVLRVRSVYMAQVSNAAPCSATSAFVFVLCNSRLASFVQALRSVAMVCSQWNVVAGMPACVLTAVRPLVCGVCMQVLIPVLGTLLDNAVSGVSAGLACFLQELATGDTGHLHNFDTCAERTVSTYKK